MTRIRLTGALKCTPDDVAVVEAALPEHVRLTRQEPGCISFDVMQDPNDPTRFNVAELFESRAAFDAHQTRTKASDWFEKTAHIPRDFAMEEV